jgi:hypothetical protein
MYFIFNIKSQWFRRLIWIFTTFFIAFQVLYFFTAKEAILDSVPIGVETILIFIYIIYFLFEQFKTQRSNYIYSHPGFWIVIGIMIYLGGTFFFNILVNHMPPQQVAQYWYFTFIADIIKNICFAIALSVYIRKPDENSLKNKPSVPYLDMV